GRVPAHLLVRGRPDRPGVPAGAAAAAAEAGGRGGRRAGADPLGRAAGPGRWADAPGPAARAPLARSTPRPDPERDPAGVSPSWALSGGRRALVAPVLVLQQPLVELPGGVARQFGAEVDRARALVVREMVAAVRD